jgi:hypothetical protein
MRLAAALCCLTLGACAAPIGDLGRRERSIYADAMTDTAGPFARVTAQGNSLFPYTDEERELRHLGWDLVRPPDRDVPGNAQHEVRWWRALPDSWYGNYPQQYWSALQVLPVASHETRFQRVILQARADGARLPAFRDAATRVGHADGARRGAALAVGATPAFAAEAERRIAENRGVVAAVCRALALRIGAYRYAVGRLMVETPSTRSVEAEAAIDALAWEAGDCGGAIRRIAGAGRGIVVTPRDRFLPGGDGAVPAK